MAETEGTPELSRTEKAALTFSRFMNEQDLPKRFQYGFNRAVTWTWVHKAVGPRVYVDNIDSLASSRPDRGVVLAANHRSFFDQWVNMLALIGCGADWIQRFYFPVRSNFFYERVPGLLVNYLVGMGAMYPPIFRDRAKSAFNRDAVDRLIRYLQSPHTAIGVHPEGTRGKGPDPYELLPAQPGIGEIILKARPLVVPLFVHGITNSFLNEVFLNRGPVARRQRPIILVYGDPIDLSDFDGKKPRAVLYKKCADRVREAIVDLIPREQDLRARCASGEISEDDPGWLWNRTGPLAL